MLFLLHKARRPLGDHPYAAKALKDAKRIVIQVWSARRSYRGMRRDVASHAVWELFVQLYMEEVEVPPQPHARVDDDDCMLFPTEDEVRTDLAQLSRDRNSMEVDGVLMAAAVMSPETGKQVRLGAYLKEEDAAYAYAAGAFVIRRKDHFPKMMSLSDAEMAALEGAIVDDVRHLVQKRQWYRWREWRKAMDYIGVLPGTPFKPEPGAESPPTKAEAADSDTRDAEEDEDLTPIPLASVHSPSPTLALPIPLASVHSPSPTLALPIPLASVHSPSPTLALPIPLASVHSPSPTLALPIPLASHSQSPLLVSTPLPPLGLPIPLASVHSPSPTLALPIPLASVRFLSSPPGQGGPIFPLLLSPIVTLSQSLSHPTAPLHHHPFPSLFSLPPFAGQSLFPTPTLIRGESHFPSPPLTPCDTVPIPLSSFPPLHHHPFPMFFSLPPYAGQSPFPTPTLIRWRSHLPSPPLTPCDTVPIPLSSYISLAPPSLSLFLLPTSLRRAVPFPYSYAHPLCLCPNPALTLFPPALLFYSPFPLLSPVAGRSHFPLLLSPVVTLSQSRSHPTAPLNHHPFPSFFSLPPIAAQSPFPTPTLIRCASFPIPLSSFSLMRYCSIHPFLSCPPLQGGPIFPLLLSPLVTLAVPFPFSYAHPLCLRPNPALILSSPPVPFHSPFHLLTSLSGLSHSPTHNGGLPCESHLPSPPLTPCDTVPIPLSSYCTLAPPSLPSFFSLPPFAGQSPFPTPTLIRCASVPIPLSSFPPFSLPMSPGALVPSLIPAPISLPNPIGLQSGRHNHVD
ncbi:unnamed protein product [Closterium sp. NIES-64]|nr:unnamed protein product [Closterium sp. NIES-64]